MNNIFYDLDFAQASLPPPPVRILQLVTVYVCIYSGVTLVHTLITKMNSVCHCHSIFSMTPMTLSIGRAPEVIKHFEVKPDLERILIQDNSSNRNFVRIVAENGPFAIVPKHNSYICCCNPIARKIWTDSLEKRARIVFITDDKTDVTEEIVDWVFPIQQQFKIEDKVHGILPVPTNLERVSTEKLRVKTCWTGYDGDVRITDLCAGNCRAIDFYDYLTI
jgi:hypothetical protein